MTRKGVTDEQYGEVSRKLDELKRRILEGAISDHTLDALQGGIEGEGVLIVRYREMMALKSAVFQSEKLRVWNALYRWGFPEEEFRARSLLVEKDFRIIAKASRLGSLGLTAAVLVPYFNTAEETFRALWSACCGVYGLKGSLAFGSTIRTVELADGIEHPGRCLRWEAVDLAANFSPDTNTPIVPCTWERRRNAAHASVLAAALYFPMWLFSTHGVGGISSVRIAGYKVNKNLIPTLGFDRESYTPTMSLQEDGMGYSVAIPEIL